MKLKVYQQGGGLIYTPFLPNKTQTSSSSTSGSEEQKIDPLDKELLGLLKDSDLLPSDVELISRALTNFQKQTQHLSNPLFGGSTNYRSVMPGVLQIQKMITTAKFNKTQWDKAVSEMQKHDAGAEVALTSNGRMFVMNNESGKIDTVSPSEFDGKKYTPISNSQLLQYRERSAGMDKSLLNSMTDLVGKQDVYKAINEIIKAYGTNDKVSLITKDTAVQAAILDMNSPDGIYKLTVKHTAADLNRAFKVLYDELPTNMQHLLKANAALSGEDNPELGAYKFIHSIITNNISSNESVEYEASVSKAAGKGESDDPKNLNEKNYVEQVIKGDNFQWPTASRFYVSGKHPAIFAYTQNTGLVQAGINGGQGVGYMPLDKLRNIEVLAQGSNQQKITFGDQQVSTAQQAAIVYDDSAMYRVKLPSKEDNGDIVPNWTVIDLIDQLKDRIDPSLGKEQIDRILHQYDKTLYWDDETNTIACTDSHWFLSFTGIVGSDFVRGLNYDSDHFDEITGPDAQMWHKRYDEAIKQNGKTAASQGSFGWLTTTKLYRANVYMPITNPLAGSREFYSKASHMNNMQTQAIQQHRAEEQAKKQNGTLKTNWGYGE